ncbi:MAG: single-stranded-DNA-specific exonuclease RecJ [Nitrospinota bacterium]
MSADLGQDKAARGRFRWRLASPAPQEAKDLARALNLPPLVGGLLWNRGLSQLEAARNFLRASIEDLHDPFLMKDMDRAVDRVARALAEGERIIVFGDYDADGLCATALLVHFFRELGREVETYIPDRLREGFGVSAGAVAGLGVKGRGLLVTVDTGITNTAEVEAAQAIGLDVIITDHHQPPEKMPPALAILNPHRPGCGYPDKGLCGSAIVFKFLTALRRRLRDTGGKGGFPILRRYLDLVALATVADVADVQGENRTLLRHGLRELAASARPGLQALIRFAGTSPEITAEGNTLAYGQVAFQLAPRINAAGRLGKAHLGLVLLLERDRVKGVVLGGQLDAANRERQALQKEVYQQARSRVLADLFHADGPIVLAEQGWHAGVVGIVASKLVEEFHRPVILIALEGDLGKGSGRSAFGLHLQKALSECSDLLEKFGGHAQAAGLTIRKERLGQFNDRFSAVVRKRMSFEEERPVLDVDARVRLSDLSLETVGAVEGLSPFGPGNARPVLCAEGLRVVGKVRTVGRDGRHLKIELHDPASGHSAEAIGFGMGNADELDFLSRPNAWVEAAFEPEVNRWNSRETLQLSLRDLRSGDVEPSGGI